MESVNIALGTLIAIFIFFIPGLIFYRFYYSGFFSRQFIKSAGSLFYLIPSFVASVIIHAVFYKISQQFVDLKIDLEECKKLLLYFKQIETGSGFNDNLILTEVTIALYYNFVLWAFAAFCGFFSQRFIRFIRADRKMSLFRFRNTWHYILRGEILDFPHTRGDYEKVKFTSVDLLTNTGDQLFVYTGILEHYNLTNEGSGLDNIIISKYRRKVILPPEGKATEYQDFVGDLLIVPYEHIINLKVKYWYVSELTTKEKILRIIKKIIVYFIFSPILLIFGPLHWLSKKILNWVLKRLNDNKKDDQSD